MVAVCLHEILGLVLKRDQTQGARGEAMAQAAGRTAPVSGRVSAVGVYVALG